MDRGDRRLRPLPPRRARGRRRTTSSDALAIARSRGDSFIWIGLHEPTEDELDKVAAEFSLHPLAIEDARQGPPAAQGRGVRRLACSSSSRRCATTRTRQQIELGDVMLFVGDSFVVTVRHGQGRALADVRQRLERSTRPARLRPVRRPLRDRRRDRRRLQRRSPSRSRRTSRRSRSGSSPPTATPRRGPDLQPQARGHRVPPGACGRWSSRWRGWPSGQVAARRTSDLQPFFRDVADHAVRVSRAGRGLRRPAQLGAQRQPGAGRRAAERGHAPDLGLGRDRGRADDDRRASTG